MAQDFIPNGGEIVQDAEKVLSSKWLWAGVAVAALVGGYFWISGQLSAIANSSATDSSMTGAGSNLLPASYSVSPLSAVGASDSGGGGGGAISTAGGSSGSGATIDPGILQLEENQTSDNFQLGLSQLQSTDYIAALSAQTAQMGLAVQQQGADLQVASSLTQALSSLFSKAGNKSTSMVQNLNGSFNIDGTPIGFNVNLGNYQGGSNATTTIANNINSQIGSDNAAISGPTLAAVTTGAGSTPGAGGSSVASGQSSSPGVSSYVAGSRGGDVAASKFSATVQ